METDNFGVPRNLFGNHPEEFYGALGRIVALAALLESKLLTLVETLEECPQGTYRLEPAHKLASLARRHTMSLSPSLRQRLEAFLGSFTVTMNTRNAIVHSSWPAQPNGIYFGWRPTRNKGQPDGRSDTVNMTHDELLSFIRQLVTLIGDCPKLWSDIASARRTHVGDCPPRPVKTRDATTEDLPHGYGAPPSPPPPTPGRLS